MLRLFLLIFIPCQIVLSQVDTKEYLRAKATLNQSMLQKAHMANAMQTENQKMYDVTYYDIDLDLDVPKSTIHGSVLIRATVVSGSLDRAEIDLDDEMQVDSVHVAGVDADFQHSDDILTVALGNEMTATESFEIRVYYHGSPRRFGFGAFSFDEYLGQPMIWSLSEPFGARAWWPCKDAPADKADSVDIRATVPSNLIVASNGLLREKSTNGGRTTFWWHESYPITTYLVSVAIHPYYVYNDWYVYDDHDSMEVQFYVLPGRQNTVRPYNALTVPMIAAFSDIFGQYPFIDEKYGHAEFLWGGGMEHQTITSLGGVSEGLIAHELAHQWWGDMITCETFHHIWLNEGFATYSEALWYEYQYGEAELHRDMQRNVYLGGGTIYVENPEFENIFEYGLSYAKGAWVLHMLRHVVGDDDFFTILRTLYSRYKFKTLNTRQFQELCENVSGIPLATFFQQWIYQEGHPVYEYLWEYTELTDGRYQINGVINQVQSIGPVFEMPIDITVTTPIGDTTVVLHNSLKEQPFQFVVDAEPERLVLDRQNWILKETRPITRPKFALQSFTLADADGNTGSALKPGQESELVITLANEGTTSSDVNAELLTGDTDVEIRSDRAHLGVMEYGATARNTAEAFLVSVSPQAHGHLVSFQLKVTAAPGLETMIEFKVKLGNPTMLIVDDDNGSDYEQYYQNMAYDVGFFVDTWDVLKQGVPPVHELQTFQAVIWFTGDDRQTTLTVEEQDVIQRFLQAGGKLLLTGQDIGYDLVENGTSADSLFYQNVLLADYEKDTTQDIAIVGIPNDTIGNGIAIRLDDLFGGAENQESPDVIRPIEPAESSLQYFPGRETAGIRIEHSQNGSRLVYLAFGIEGIAGPRKDSAAQLLARIVAWLNGAAHIHDPYFQIPGDFVLNQNYPNPFNPTTTIQFSVPQKSQVTLYFYNTLGQRVRTMQGTFDYGWHAITWDGTDASGRTLASGVYLLAVRYENTGGSGVHTIKMVKLE